MAQLTDWKLQPQLEIRYSDKDINQYYEKIYGKKYDQTLSEQSSKLKHPQLNPQRSRMSLLPSPNSTKDIKYHTLPVHKWRMERLRNLESIIHKNKKLSLYGAKEKPEYSTKMLQTLSTLRIEQKKQKIMEIRKKQGWMPRIHKIRKMPIASEMSEIPEMIKNVTQTIKTVKSSAKDIITLSTKLESMRKDISKFQDHYDQQVTNVSNKSPIGKIKSNSQSTLKKIHYDRNKDGFASVLKLRDFKINEKQDQQLMDTMFMFIDQAKKTKEQEIKDNRRKQFLAKTNSDLKWVHPQISPMKYLEDDKMYDTGFGDIYVSKLLNDEDREANTQRSIAVEVPKIRNASLNQTSQAMKEKKYKLVKS